MDHSCLWQHFVVTNAKRGWYNQPLSPSSLHYTFTFRSVTTASEIPLGCTAPDQGVCTLQVQPAAKRINARLEFAFVYPDKRGRNVMRMVGALPVRHFTRR